MSPFDKLIIQSQIELWSSVRSGISEEKKDMASFLIQQLGLLRTAYIYLVEAGRQTIQSSKPKPNGITTISIEEAAIEVPRTSREIFLSYYSFINILCQLNRVLPRHFSSVNPIPLYNRIRFYRNVAVEHWDEYTKNIAQGGFTFKEDKAPVPVIEAVYILKDRQSLFKELKNTFTTFGVNLTWDDTKIFSLIGTNPEYSEAVFTALEGTGMMAKHAGKNANYDKLISLLLMFGFPTPIIDIEDYSGKLVEYLKQLISNNK